MNTMVKNTLFLNPVFPKRIKTTVANKKIPKIIAHVFDSLDKVKTSVFDNGKEKKMRLIKIVRPINKKAIDKS